MRSGHHWEIGFSANLRALAALLRNQLGYDFVEHGCQGLGRRVSLQSIELVLSGELPAIYDLPSVNADTQCR